MALSCDNCPLVWNAPDFKGKISVSRALFIISQYTVITDILEEDLCKECQYIDYSLAK